MFLSTPRKIAFVLGFFAGLTAACGGSQTTPNTVVNAAAEFQKRFPFPLREPDTYQADVVITADGVEERCFIARQGERWRFDMFANGAPSLSRLRNGSLYLLDHTKRSVREEPSQDNTLMPTLASDATRRF